MLNFGALKPKVKGARAHGSPPGSAPGQLLFQVRGRIYIVEKYACFGYTQKQSVKAKDLPCVGNISYFSQQ